MSDLGYRGALESLMFSELVMEEVMTLFRFVHTKVTSFALSVDTLTAQNTVQFSGKNVEFKISKAADLVHATFVHFQIPGIVGILAGDPITVLSSPTTEPYWTNAIGQFLVQQADLVIGTVLVDTLKNHYLFVWEEVSGKAGKRLSEMIGKFDTVAMRQAQSRRARDLYVPLPFYYTEITGLSLPTASLTFQPCSIKLSFPNLEDCIVKPSGWATGMTVYKRAEGASNGDVESDSSKYEALKPADLSCELEVFEFWLEEDERERFVTGQFEQILTQVQYFQETTSKTLVTADDSTPHHQYKPRVVLNNVITEYLIYVRRQKHETDKDWFNFGGYDDPITQSILDPIKTLAVKYDNQTRVDARPGKFFRLVVPQVFHSNVPHEFIYVWSFATEPEDPNVTGGTNQGKLDNLFFEFAFDPRIFVGSASLTVFITARNRNVMRFKHGFVTLRFY